MEVLLFAAACLGLLWALLILVISPFFRAMALSGVGAELVHLASTNHFPVWLMLVGCCFLFFPVATLFRRTIFGE